MAKAFVERGLLCELGSHRVYVGIRLRIIEMKLQDNLDIEHALFKYHSRHTSFGAMRMTGPKISVTIKVMFNGAALLSRTIVLM